MSFSVRPARPEDYAAGGALTVAAYAQYQPLLRREEWEEYRADLADLAGRAERGTVFVAEDADGTLLGVVTYYRHVADGPRADWWWWPADYGYIRALAVHPDARGRGVGRALMHACLEEARASGAAGVALNTARVMSAARSLYESLGFHMLPAAEGDRDGDLDYGGFHFFSYVLELSTIPPG